MDDPVTYEGFYENHSEGIQTLYWDTLSDDGLMFVDVDNKDTWIGMKNALTLREWA